MKKVRVSSSSGKVRTTHSQRGSRTMMEPAWALRPLADVVVEDPDVVIAFPSK